MMCSYKQKYKEISSPTDNVNRVCDHERQGTLGSLSDSAGPWELSSAISSYDPESTDSSYVRPQATGGGALSLVSVLNRPKQQEMTAIPLGNGVA